MNSKPINSTEAKRLIVERAQQLVDQLIEFRGNYEPPFLPEDYFRFVNIKNVKQNDLGDTSALLLKFHDGHTIKVNQNHSQVRQNFSCAHEIGHILFSELKLENYVRTIEYRTFNDAKKVDMRVKARETLCDAAAAELLMPRFAFNKYLSQNELSIYSLEALTEAFNVSRQAAVRRIAEVSNGPYIVTLWYPFPKKKPKGLRALLIKRENGNYCRPVKDLVDISSSLFKAYKENSIVKTWKLYKVGESVKRLKLEAKGYGYGEAKYVVSIAFDVSQNP